MSLLIFFITISIAVSFLCSILEAVLLSISPSYLLSIRESSPKIYKKLNPLRKDIEKPLAAILSLNTIAHTIGATGAGAQVQVIYGSEWLTAFSAVLTVAILILSEIIPKSIGARYWKGLAPMSARIIPSLIFITYPLVWASDYISRFIKRGAADKITRDEVKALADIGYKDGALTLDEYNTLKNFLSFPHRPIKDIIRPIEVVKSLPENLSTLEAYDILKKESYSRYPILGVHEDDLKGYVLRSVVYDYKIRNESVPITSVAKKILHVDSNEKIRRVFLKLMKRREHIAAVINEDSHFMGIITLEDIIESLLGIDIKDETDEN
ncbi:membrane protein, PF01595 family [Bacteriovorax sp. BSW11_IV]|uniref:CNNM domain-containing protein n=1 Tax=Bacteriovorax sp. BSW11_IV TaxID=1353529 RepID=UPI00038A510C|nr:CNNM domain-containing protein [Bacteriovorax sp. BSW11_IV]EQC48759.1 membrane protein, PF01595 family [Bacteriovorax sp. BSW11_IV]